MNSSNIRQSTSLALLLGLLSLYLLIGAGLVYTFAGEKAKQRILLQYELEQISAGAVNAFLRNTSFEELYDQHRLLGFALYNEEKQSLVSLGEVPTEDEVPDRSSIRYGNNGETIIIRRELFKPRTPQIEGWTNQVITLFPLQRNEGEELHFEFPERRLSTTESPLPPEYRELRNKLSAEAMTELQNVLAENRANYPRQIYFELPLESYLQPLRTRFLLLTAILAVLLGALLTAWRLLIRNLRYRHALREQEEALLFGEAARTLVHEIKSPLSAIRLQTGILKRSDAEAGVDELAIIEEESERLSRLAGRIREFLSNTRGQPEAIEADEFIRRTVERLPGDFKLKLAAPGRRIMIDPDRFRSVVENIILNARESAGWETEVDIKSEIRRRKLLVTFRDHGPGIPTEIQRRLFDPFFTTKPGGSGIGLSIARRFIRSAGGNIWGINHPEGGARLIIRLPLSEEV